MAVTFDNLGISPVRFERNIVGFQQSIAFNVLGGHACMGLICVLTRRNDLEGGDVLVTGSVDGSGDLVDIAKVWLDYDAEAQNASFLQVYGCRMAKGPHLVNVAWIGDSPMDILSRFVVLSYRYVGDFGGTDVQVGGSMSGGGAGTSISHTYSGVSGGRIVHVAAAEQYSNLTGYNQTERSQIDLQNSQVISQGIIGDAEAGPSVTFNATRIVNRDWASLAIELRPAPTHKRLRVRRQFPRIPGPVVATPTAARLRLKTETPNTLLKLFAPATVLTLNGLNYNETDYMQNLFGGMFNTAPYTRRKIEYPASNAVDTIEPTGVENLDATLRATEGRKIVMAHDLGAHVATRWMYKYRDDPTAPSAEELMFILVGNPLRNGSGYMVGREEVGGAVGLATPLDTPWDIIDVAARYDGTCDWPGDGADDITRQNANSGRYTLHESPYFEMDLFDPLNSVWREGNTTFVLSPFADESPPPIIRNWVLLGDQGRAVRQAYKRHIEKQYDRPVPEDVVVDVTPNAYWSFILARLGVDYS